MSLSKRLWLRYCYVWDPGRILAFRINEVSFSHREKLQPKSIVPAGLEPSSTVSSFANIWTAAAVLLASALEFY